MPWPIPWGNVLNELEALGLLAVFFAAGIAAGFWLSRMARQPARRKPPSPPARAAIPEKIIARDTARMVAQAAPQPVPAPAAPVEKTAPSPPQPAALPIYRLRARYPVTAFGTGSLTRPPPGQPPS